MVAQHQSEKPIKHSGRKAGSDEAQPLPSFEWQGGISGGARPPADPDDGREVKMQDAGPEDDNNP